MYQMNKIIFHYVFLIFILLLIGCSSETPVTSYLVDKKDVLSSNAIPVVIKPVNGKCYSKGNVGIYITGFEVDGKNITPKISKNSVALDQNPSPCISHDTIIAFLNFLNEYELANNCQTQRYSLSTVTLESKDGYWTEHEYLFNKNFRKLKILYKICEVVDESPHPQGDVYCILVLSES